MNQLAGACRKQLRAAWGLVVLLVLAVMAGGCTTLSEYVHNGFKVGPKFHRPPAPVEADWIDAADARVAGKPVNEDWWNVFEDAALVSLIDAAHQQNLTLKIAATRVLQARAQRNITAGNLLPQSQNALGLYDHAQLSKNLSFVPGGGQGNGQNMTGGFPQIFNVWATGFNLSWELDFWGRLRRAVESSNAALDASAESYRAALVTLLADVAVNYVQVRTFQQRIAYARQNIALQKGSLRIAEDRLKEGRATGLDVEQAKNNLAQTEASIPPLEIGVRQANNRLCVLLGLPPYELVAGLGVAPIPAVPPEVAVGIPAELLQRRPDVRQAQRLAAAQSAQIGVAESDFYPHIRVFGFMGYAASDIRRLFDESSFTGFIVPTFQWKILNFGRVLNNLRGEKALFRQRVLEYQQTVLTAGREVEDALVGFLQYQLQARSLEKSVRAGERSVELVMDQYRGGRADFNRVFTTQSQLVIQLDRLAVARGNIALSLISVYRALGGGWRVFEGGSPSQGGAKPLSTEAAPNDAPELPKPRPAKKDSED